MKGLFKSGIIFIMILFSTILISCGGEKKDSKDVTTEKTKEYSEAILVEGNESSDVFNVNEKNLQRVEERENVSNVLCNKKSSTYVYSLIMSQGKNLVHNMIKINKNNKDIEINNFYSYLDLKLSPSGRFLAFRSFSQDSLESAQGLKVYDIDRKKYIDINSKVLVSGNLYQWIDQNKIVYYGGIEGEKNSNKMYIYDLEKNTENIYLDKLEGICTYFVPINSNILCLTTSALGSALKYYDLALGQSKSVNVSVEKIYKAVIKDDSVYFIGSDDGINNALYEFSSKTLTVNRITYDFPKYINSDAGIALDSKGYIYFSGNDEKENNQLYDVYMYNTNSKSINLISNHPSNYRIGGSLYY